MKKEKSARGRGAFLKIRSTVKGGKPLQYNCDANPMGGSELASSLEALFWGGVRVGSEKVFAIIEGLKY